MLEDNQIQTQENVIPSSEYELNDIDQNHQKIETSIDTKSPKDTISKSTQTMSKDISNYISIPDINKEIPIQQTKTTLMDKINLWSIIFIIIAFMMFTSFEKFKIIIEKMRKNITKYSFLINFLYIIIGMGIFLYPNKFGNEISGNISIISMIEFTIIILLNTLCFVLIKLNYLKNKNLIFKNKKITFSGIKFLKLSMITFSLTGFLFFMFTESKIGFILFYLITGLTLLLLFMQLNGSELTKLKPLILLSIIFQFMLIGNLVNIYAITTIGAILAGSIISNIEQSKDLYSHLKKII